MARGRATSLGPSLRDVTVRRGSFTLTCREWETESGLTAVVGLNGAGKSTFLQLITGLLQPNSGSVIRCPGTNFLPQSATLNTRQTVRELYGYIAGLRGLRRSEREGQCERAITLCGLERFADTRFNDLSGGWKQRTLVGQTLLGEPQLVVLDEPTASLDVGASRDLWRLMQELAHETTFIVATHEASASLEFCDGLAVVQDGVVEQARDGGELRSLLAQHTGSPESFLIALMQGRGDA